jgi:hypothetical protein
VPAAFGGSTIAAGFLFDTRAILSRVFPLAETLLATSESNGLQSAERLKEHGCKALLDTEGTKSAFGNARRPLRIR